MADFNNEDLKVIEKAKADIIEEQGNGDKETAHMYADQALCDILRQLGLKDIVDEYEAIDKWYA